MLAGFIACLILCSVDADYSLLHVTGVTARSVLGHAYTPEKAIDGVVESFYHSSLDSEPEHLQLTLEDLSVVSSVTIVNRYDCFLQVLDGNWKGTETRTNIVMKLMF